MDELQLLRKKVREYREQLKEYLAVGSAQNIEGYYRIVGRIEAFSAVESDLEEMIERHVDL